MSTIELPEDTRIAGYFEEIYVALTARGVPEDRLPTPWAILSHVLDCTDYDALEEWIENFSALEGVNEPDTDGTDTDDTDETDGIDTDGDTEDSPPRRRPSYLRALPSRGPPLPETPETPESGS